MKKYLIEFIGTFFLVLAITLTTHDPLSVQPGDPPFAPIAIGCMLMAMVYMGRHISGAHYNPAITLAVLILKKISPKEALAYMGFQVPGALLASHALYFIAGETDRWCFGPSKEFDSLFIPVMAELVFTFALGLVVLNVAMSSKTAGNSYYGLAIGGTIVALAYAGGPLSGGAFNPAAGAGQLMAHALMFGCSPDHWWIYLVGPFTGGALAAAVFKFTDGRN